MSSTRSSDRSLAPAKAIEILKNMVDNAWPLQNEPWASPKREQWTTTARAILERAFSSDSSIVQKFDSTDTFAFNAGTSNQELRRMANDNLESQIAILRSAIVQLGWEPDETRESLILKGPGAVGATNTTPSNILSDAIKAVPAVRYALGVAGIVAAIAIIKGFNIDARVAVVGTVIMLILMTVLVVFARLTTMAPKQFVRLALFFAWFSMLITMTVAILLLTSVFWSKPIDLRDWIAKERKDSGAYIQIVNPGTGTSVGREVLVRGTAALSQSRNEHLWILVSSKQFTHQWWPQTEAAVAPDTHEWKACAYLGEEDNRDIGLQFTIAAVAVSGEDQQRIQEYAVNARKSDFKPMFLSEQLPQQQVTVTKQGIRGKCE